MIKNIIFDWAGVLSDDIIPSYKAIMNMFMKWGIKTLTLEEFKREFTIPYMNFYRKFTNMPKKKVDDLFIKEIYVVGEPRPFKGVKNLLNFLDKRAINLVLLSSHPQKKLEEEIERYCLQKFFVEVNGSVHDKTKIIEKIMKRNEFAPEETAYVGDMTHDIEAGKMAGVMTIAVSWGYQTKEQLRREKPDLIIDKLEEIKKIVFDG